MIGMPESRIILSEAVIYLATSPKKAIQPIWPLAWQTGCQTIPGPGRAAPFTKCTHTSDEKPDYGKDYLYAHDYAGNFIKQKFPQEISGGTFIHHKIMLPKSKSTNG